MTAAKVQEYSLYVSILSASIAIWLPLTIIFIQRRADKKKAHADRIKEFISEMRYEYGVLGGFINSIMPQDDPDDMILSLEAHYYIFRVFESINRVVALIITSGDKDLKPFVLTIKELVETDESPADVPRLNVIAETILDIIKATSLKLSKLTGEDFHILWNPERDRTKLFSPKSDEKP